MRFSRIPRLLSKGLRGISGDLRDVSGRFHGDFRGAFEGVCVSGAHQSAVKDSGDLKYALGGINGVSESPRDVSEGF